MRYARTPASGTSCGPLAQVPRGGRRRLSEVGGRQCPDTVVPARLTSANVVDNSSCRRESEFVDPFAKGFQFRRRICLRQDFAFRYAGRLRPGG
jgi:hypothetical protein